MQSRARVDRTRIDAIREQIRTSLVMSIYDQRFLPSDKLHAIFTLPVIKGAVQELSCEPEERIKLTETIYNEGKRVFAILIHNAWEDHIIDFRKHGVLDNQLPLSTERANAIMGPSCGDRFASEFQWTFIPFTFPKCMWESEVQIDRPQILPFVSANQIGAGASGQVHRIDISPSQQNFPQHGVNAPMQSEGNIPRKPGTDVILQPAEVAVVRKQLRAEDSMDEFRKEGRCLRLLNQLRHPNIIPFWGSYMYRGEHNFLFPYIDMDLGKFLTSRSRHKEFMWDFTFYSALTGLASALAKTHRLHLNENQHDVNFEAIGYHHDLRPPNVLVSQDTFILADFGLGRLKDAAAQSYTLYKPIGGDYIAPECTDMDETRQTVNRGIDVWAFGCLIVEVVTYMIKGADGIEAFRKKRLTNSRLPLFTDAGFYQPHGEVKQEVLDWIEELRRTSSPTGSPADLLDLSFQALQKDPQQRPTMEEMHRHLEFLDLRRQFDSVLDMFPRARGAGDPCAAPQHHLESLKLAQERFEIWGQVLGLHENSLSSDDFESMGKSITVARNLFHVLREETGERSCGDSSVLRSMQHDMDQNIKELWDSLPESLLRNAENELRQRAGQSGLLEQMPRLASTAEAGMSVVAVAASSDAYLRELEDSAQYFKKQVPESVPFDDVLKARSINDVYDVTEALQASQGLCDLQRMQPYLASLLNYAGIVQDTIRGSQDVLAYLWGPLALLLRWSSKLNTAYNAIIEVTATIGEALPDFQTPGTFLRRNTESKEIIVLIFKDLLNFYLETLRSFSQPGWIHVFDRSWPKHLAIILEVGSHIRRLTRLMRAEISLEHIQQEYEFRKDALEKFKKQEREGRRQLFNCIKTSLNLREYHDALYRNFAKACSGSEAWLFSHETYVKWSESSMEQLRILWLKGIPGSGKSVLSSAVVHHFIIAKTELTGFAFLTYKDESVSALSIFQSLIFQLAEGDDSRMDIICRAMDDGPKGNLGFTTDLLESLIRFTGPVCLVIDGMDEIGEQERGTLATELCKLVQACESLRIILSSRAEADLGRMLDHATFAIEIHEHNESSIEFFVGQRTEEVLRYRGVLPGFQGEIRRLLVPLASRAKGMFLFARLIMQMVERIQDLSELKNELTVLPKNLDEAYHRIISRLKTHDDNGVVEQRMRLLGWIACSPIALTAEEAQQALIVRPRTPEQSYSMVAKLDVLDILGPIVETVDGYIQLVHFTAKEYISSPHLGELLVDVNRATMDLAIVCIEYLCQQHHDTKFPSEEGSQNILSGQYAFHAYAARMWFELSCHHLQSDRTLEHSASLANSVLMLWERRKTESSQFPLDVLVEGKGKCQDWDASEEESDEELVPNRIGEKWPLLHRVLRMVSRFRCSSFVYTGESDRARQWDKRDPLSTFEISESIRKGFDKLLCNQPRGWTDWESAICHENCAYILHYYGPRPFKCKFARCKFARHGFHLRNDRDKHEHSHEKPLFCHVPGCEFALIGFLSESMRQKHIQEGHLRASDPRASSLDTQGLKGDDIEPLLRILIQRDRVEDTKKVMSALPSPLPNSERFKFLELASFEASPAMLEALGSTQNNFDFRYALQAINGRKRKVLRYFVAQSYASGLKIGDNRLINEAILVEFISSGWLDGLKYWCDLLRAEWANTSARRLQNVKHRVQTALRDAKVIKAATAHPYGEESLLYLWRDSRWLSYVYQPRDWASRTLIKVARFGFSITLAAYLIEIGADVNKKVTPTGKTALHWAAVNKSAEAADMMRFLLLNGADPEATQNVPRKPGIPASVPTQIKRIGDEEGAKNIAFWLRKSWDELVEETKHVRSMSQNGEALSSDMGAEALQHGDA